MDIKEKQLEVDKFYNSWRQSQDELIKLKQKRDKKILNIDDIQRKISKFYEKSIKWGDLIPDNVMYNPTNFEFFNWCMGDLAKQDIDIIGGMLKTLPPKLVTSYKFETDPFQFKVNGKVVLTYTLKGVVFRPTLDYDDFEKFSRNIRGYTYSITNIEFERENKDLREEANNDKK